MTDTEKLETLISKLKEIAHDCKNTEKYDFYNPADNGDFNEAYGDGYHDGTVDMARELLATLKNTY